MTQINTTIKYTFQKEDIEVENKTEEIFDIDIDIESEDLSTTQKKIINVKRIDDFFIVYTNNETYKLINMDAHFHFNSERNNLQNEKLISYIK